MLGDARANRILLVVTTLVAVVVCFLGWLVLALSRGPNACRAHGGQRMGVRAPGPPLPERVVCVDGTVVMLGR
jgi:hypothetical protein